MSHVERISALYDISSGPVLAHSFYFMPAPPPRPSRDFYNVGAAPPPREAATAPLRASRQAFVDTAVPVVEPRRNSNNNLRAAAAADALPAAALTTAHSPSGRQFAKLADFMGPRTTTVPHSKPRQVPLLCGRESNTSNMGAFENYYRLLRRTARRPGELMINTMFWESIHGMLSQYRDTLGMHSLPGSDQALPVEHDLLEKFQGRLVEQLTYFLPVNPHELSKRLGIPESAIITELLMATRVGLIQVRFAVECSACKGDIAEAERLHDIRRTNEHCAFCETDTVVSGLEQVKTNFFFADDVLYCPMQNGACRLSQQAIHRTALSVAFPATESGSGFCFTVKKPLPKGEYLFRCRLTMTEKVLVVLHNATPASAPHDVIVRVSSLKASRRGDVMTVPHGNLTFHVYPDTGTLFAVWLMSKMDGPDTSLHVPREVAAKFVPAAVTINHPVYVHAFPKDVLHPDVAFTVESVTILATQLCEMDSLLDMVGDQRTLQVVHDVRAAVSQAIFRHGRVLKATDDWVLGAFVSPAEALRACSRAFRYVARNCRPPEGGPHSLTIRCGVHIGPGMISFANGVSEYFGKTVTMALSIARAGTSNTLLISKEAYAQSMDVCSMLVSTEERRRVSVPSCDNAAAMESAMAACADPQLVSLPTLPKQTTACGASVVGLRWVADQQYEALSA
jgi:class 3 adenylate cyclase